MKAGVGGATVAAKPSFGLTPSSELCLIAATASFRCAEMMITSGLVPLSAISALETSVVLRPTLVEEVYALADGRTVMFLAWASFTPDSAACWLKPSLAAMIATDLGAGLSAAKASMIVETYVLLGDRTAKVFL